MQIFSVYAVKNAKDEGKLANVGMEFTREYSTWNG